MKPPFFNLGRAHRHSTGSSSSRIRAAFTMVEMLVAIGVLGVLILLLSQIFNTSSNVMLLLSKNLDADAQARLVLDRISYDVSQMILRDDIDYHFPAPASATASDQMYFFAESSGYYPSGLTPAEPTGLSTTSRLDPRSPVSLIGYRINPTTLQLERLSKGLVWTGVTGGNSVVYLPGTIAGTWAGLAADKDFQVIGEGVFRLQIQYLVQTSGAAAYISNVPNTKGLTPGTPGYFSPRNVKAIVISVAILDPASQKILKAGALSQAAEALLTAAAPNLPVATWRAGISTLPLPPSAASHIRFYQRFCYLNQHLSHQ